MEQAAADFERKVAGCSDFEKLPFAPQKVCPWRFSASFSLPGVHPHPDEIDTDLCDWSASGIYQLWTKHIGDHFQGLTAW